VIEFAFKNKSFKNNLSIRTILSPINDHMKNVDLVIKSSLHSEIPVINKISSHIINSGGKKLRPALHILVAGWLGKINKKNYQLAAILEFIHTATLLHDDVVDESSRRRHIKTANSIYGNAASVLVGDFLYSRSFQMMVDVNNMQVMQILATTTNQISEGEILQLININNLKIDENGYINIVEYKTAKLFEASCSLAAITNNAKLGEIKKLTQLGNAFGLIFQIIDDILDYTGKEKKIGKKIGDDLSQGKVTLPIILALRNGSSSQKRVLKNVLKEKNLKKLNQVINILEETNALKLTRDKAKEYFVIIQKIMGSYKANKYSDTLLKLAEYSINRES
jgi:octaprenyl-diphosphate synthase